MTDEFLTAGETNANFISDNTTDVGNCDPADPDTWLVGDFDNDCGPDLKIEIRNVEETGTYVAALTDAANDLPLQRHIGPPPAGSGYSIKHFEIRRYGVTTRSPDGNTRLQTGVFMVFNKF